MACCLSLAACRLIQYLGSRRSVFCAASCLNVNVVHFIIIPFWLAKLTHFIWVSTSKVANLPTWPQVPSTPLANGFRRDQGSSGQARFMLHEPTRICWWCSHETWPQIHSSYSEAVPIGVSTQLWIRAQGYSQGTINKNPTCTSMSMIIQKLYPIIFLSVWVSYYQGSWPRSPKGLG